MPTYKTTQRTVFVSFAVFVVCLVLINYTDLIPVKVLAKDVGASLAALLLVSLFILLLSSGRYIWLYIKEVHQHVSR